jgi:hypothetical protein
MKIGELSLLNYKIINLHLPVVPRYKRHFPTEPFILGFKPPGTPKPTPTYSEFYQIDH